MSKIKIQGSSSNETKTVTLTDSGGSVDRTLILPNDSDTSSTILTDFPQTVTEPMIRNDAVNRFISGRKNLIINGDFDVWQRGVSQDSQVDINGYGSADRWGHDIIGTSQSISQQPFSSGQTDVPNNPVYYSQSVITTSSSEDGSNSSIMYQRVEDVNSLSGETVTLSFWARTHPDTSSKNIAVSFDQYFGTGTGTPSATEHGTGTTVGLTTAWAKHSVTYTLPSTSVKTSGDNGDSSMQVNFWFDAGTNHNAITNTLGSQSGTFHIAQVQLEVGDRATDFEHRSYGEELALCQRYYYAADDFRNVYGGRYSTDSGFITFSYPVTMRSNPTLNINSDVDAQSDITVSHGTIQAGTVYSYSTSSHYQILINDVDNLSPWVRSPTADAEL
jgi:hypothetical protein